MGISCRPYRDEEDFWRLRRFLREVYTLNEGRLRSWHVARLEYARWHSCLNCAKTRLEDIALLWEEEGDILAFAMPDGGLGEAHLCVHPLASTGELERSMLELSEERLSSVAEGGSRSLRVWAHEKDGARREQLIARGYSRENWPEHIWRRGLDARIPDATLAPGFEIRALGDGLELLERCYASGLGFHEGDLQRAFDDRSDPAWYRNIQNAPLYRRDLDLVAVAADGSIASFCTIWFDDVTRSGVFEPVATVPAHRRKGLAKALMVEGLRRLARMGARTAFVSGYSPEANALYRSVMGTDADLYEPWLRAWGP